MPKKADIATLNTAQRRDPRIRRSAFSFHITPEALECTAEILGSLPAETGQLCLGPADRDGTDLVLFDERGSKNGPFVYRPDTTWRDEMLEYWRSQPDQKAWHADMHSHKGDVGFPSSDAGNARGDLGYVRAVLAANDWMNHFFFPIITGTGSDKICLWPWVLERDHPGEPRYAEVHIGPAHEFPPRRFHNAWERALESQAQQVADMIDATGTGNRALPLFLIDLDEIAAKSRTILSRDDPRGYIFRRDRFRLLVTFPSNFPTTSPKIAFVRDDDSTVELTEFRWRAASPLRPEVRIVRLIKEILRFERPFAEFYRALRELASRRI